MVSIGKKRSPYDKIVKRALEMLRQELAPLQDIKESQQKLISQNEKNTAFLREIWEKVSKGEEAPQNNLRPPT